MKTMASPASFPCLPQFSAEDVPGRDQSDCLFGQLTAVLAASLPQSAARRKALRTSLLAGGYYGPHAYWNLAAIQYLAIILPMLLCGLLLVLVPVAWEPFVIVALVGLPLAGWWMPQFVVRRQAAARRRAIQRGLSDLLPLLGVCLSQGLSVCESLKRCAEVLRHTHAALGQELAIVVAQAQVGALEQALNNLGKRVDLPDVQSLAALLTQAHRLGSGASGSLIESASTAHGAVSGC